MKTRHVLISVMAEDESGNEDAFSLRREIKRSIKSEDDVRNLFLQHEFYGKSSSVNIKKYLVKRIDEVIFLSDRFFLNLRQGLHVGKAAIQLGDHDDPESFYPDARRSLLTNLVVDFEISEGEGISFNDFSDSIRSCGAYVMNRRGNFIFLTDGSEQWIFPSAEWEYHEKPLEEIDYAMCDDFRESLPEIRASFG